MSTETSDWDQISDHDRLGAESSPVTTPASHFPTLEAVDSSNIVPTSTGAQQLTQQTDQESQIQQAHVRPFQVIVRFIRKALAYVRCMLAHRSSVPSWTLFVLCGALAVLFVKLSRPPVRLVSQGVQVSPAGITQLSPTLRRTLSEPSADGFRKLFEVMDAFRRIQLHFAESLYS